jgi:hypothetical protein
MKPLPTGCPVLDGGISRLLLLMFRVLFAGVFPGRKVASACS